jgi:hypothetical protein
MQRDYIMRLIERIAALLASIVAKERGGLHSEARADIDEKVQQTIGMDLCGVCRLSARGGVSASPKFRGSALWENGDPRGIAVARSRHF